MTDLASLQATIDDAYAARETLNPRTDVSVREAVEMALLLLDAGKVRVAEKRDGAWVVNQLLMKAVLLSFRLNPMRVIENGPGGALWWDKVPSRFVCCGAAQFERAGCRAVPT